MFGIDHLERAIDAPPDSPPPAYRIEVLADMPVAYLPLDETSGIIAHDLVEGGPAGDILGNVMLDQEPPFPGAGRAVAFDGTIGAIDLGNVFPFADNAAFSIELWAKMGANVQRQYFELISKWRSLDGAIEASGWNFYYNGDNLDSPPVVSLTRERPGQTPSGTYARSTLDVWHHLVGTYDGLAIRLYIDGAFVDQASSVKQLEALPLHLEIGAGNGDPTQVSFLGVLDEVAIYDHELSPARIAAHYEARMQ